jgi:uncharacterized protein (TIGR03663 family)
VCEDEPKLRFKAIFVGSILLAAALRLPGLALRPMHADEAIHADKFGTLLEGGGYAYDPSEYHGPTLYYLTLPSAWLLGQLSYIEIDEVTLRLVPAAFGVALVSAHIGLKTYLGQGATALSALLVALSPAMVFYSRYYIHEMSLVFFSFATLLAAGGYLRRPGTVSAAVTGVCAGLMLATKETAPIALGSTLLALALTGFVERWRGQSVSVAGSMRAKDALLALLAAFLVSAIFFSSFLSHPQGVVDSVKTYGVYLDRAHTTHSHFHPWDYYLRLLIHFPADGTPWWTEGLILVLALVGGAVGWSARAVGGGDSRAVRFLVFYSLIMIAVYSAIPYKTPWCLLGFLHGLILLAGTGAAYLLRAPRTLAVRGLVSGILFAALIQLAWQAFSGSFRLAADPRNPYVYAHTGPDVFPIIERLEQVARAHPDGAAMPIQIVSRENLWPLPFYLRGFSGVEWWRGFSDEALNAPVIVITPEMEEALVRKLYDVPPPGEKELYVRLFERPMQLRPQVELRGYAASSLWNDFRQLASDAPTFE